MAFVIQNQPDAPTLDQAEVDSVDFTIITAPPANIGVTSGCEVTAQGVPDMTLAVASGTVQVGSAIGTVASGNVTVTAADGTNPRFDLVVVNNAGTKSVVAGTAAANPVFPTIPANSVALAAVRVAAGVTSIVTANYVDRRIMLAEFALLTGKSGGQTLRGGTAASELLVLKGTSHATRGTVDLDDMVRLMPTSATYTAGVKMLSTAAATTITLDHASANIIGFQLRGTVVYEQAGWVSGASQAVFVSATFKNPSGEANSLGSHFLFNASGTYQADTQTITLPTFAALVDASIFSIASGGVLTNTAYETVRCIPTINTGATVGTLNAVHAYNPLGSGTITTLAAVDIEDLTRGTTNLSLRSLGASVQMRHAGPAVFGANAAPTNTTSVGLEVQSTTKALLLSRMTTTQRDALTAVNGMLIYNSTTNTVQARVNGVWTTI